MPKATVTTVIEFELNELKKIVADYLKRDADGLHISVVQREVGDDRFGPTHSEVVGIKITATDPAKEI